MNLSGMEWRCSFEKSGNCNRDTAEERVHRKKRFTSFLSPTGMSLTKLPLGRNNSVMTSLFPPNRRESLVVTSRLGTGNSRTFFLRCIEWVIEDQTFSPSYYSPSPSHPLQPLQPFPSVSSTGDTQEEGRLRKRDNLVMGWGRSQIKRRRESLVLYKSFSTLCSMYCTWCIQNQIEKSK